MDDTANEVASLDELLHSTGNRVEIAKNLLSQGRVDLLPTILEDLYYGVQLIMDNYTTERKDA